MPSAIPAVSRRQVLLGAVALAVVSATACACGAPPEPPKVDELESQLDLARRDSDLAKAAAAAGSSHAPALTVVADERADHAKALIQEIARATGTPPSSTETASPAGTTITSPASTPPPSLSDVTAALRNSADSASQLAAKLSGYRAGLLGSIAASCTTAVTVPLSAKEPAQ